jgi:hypothetical protein
MEQPRPLSIKRPARVLKTRFVAVIQTGQIIRDEIAGYRLEVLGFDSHVTSVGRLLLKDLAANVLLEDGGPVAQARRTLEIDDRLLPAAEDRMYAWVTGAKTLARLSFDPESEAERLDRANVGSSVRDRVRDMDNDLSQVRHRLDMLRSWHEDLDIYPRSWRSRWPSLTTLVQVLLGVVGAVVSIWLLLYAAGVFKPLGG